MRYWLFMFRPDTYEKVREHGLVGVRKGVAKRFKEISEGDKFVAYISRKQVFDGFGTMASGAFQDDSEVFGVDQLYRDRARVDFQKADAGLPAGDVMWGLTPFEDLNNTTPANILFCKGGFIEISQADFEALEAWLSSEDGATPWGAV